MPVNPAELAFFEELSKSPPTKPINELSLCEFRGMADLLLTYTGDPENVNYKDFFIPVRDGSQCRVRIFNHNIGDSPIAICFPGGGYVVDLFEVSAIAYSRVAKYSGIKVAVVNFRLVPEYPFPQAIHDGQDVAQYLFDHAPEFAVDPDNLFVSGISAGAHCATVIANLSKGDSPLKIKRQILINGCYDMTFSNKGYIEYEDQDFLCQQAALDYVFSLWDADEKMMHPIVSPAFNSDFTGISSATIIVSEYDRLRGNSEFYFQQLKDKDAGVEKIVLPRQTHNTMLMRAVMSDGQDPAELVSDIIKQHC